MGEYAGALNLNSRKKPVGQYEENALRGGIKREQLSEKSQLIFDAINKKYTADGNVDGLLDQNEIEAFWTYLRQTAKDDTLGGREAKKVLKELELKQLSKEDLYNFVSEIYGKMENIDSSEVDQDGRVIINYKKDEEGNTVNETVNKDGSSEVKTTTKDETVNTAYLDNEHNLTKQSTVDKDGNSETVLYTDENGNVVLDKDNNSVPTHISTVAVKEGGAKISTETDCKDGVPEKAVVTEGTKTSNYVYQDGKPILTNTVVDLGNDLQRTTDFEWNENGHIETIKEPNKTTVKTFTNFQTEDNKVVALPTKEEITQGTTNTTNVYDYDKNLKQETIVEENGNTTQNIYGMLASEEGGVNFVKLQQTKRVNGKEYQVEYDGQGNTCGIVVQFDNKETNISSFCAKFNIDEAKFREVNGLKPNQKRLKVGQEVKIPKELEADARILQKRDSSEVAVAKLQRYRAEQERRKQLRAMGWDGSNFRQGEEITYGGETYRILGRKTNRARLLVMDSKGRVYTASHDNLILKDSYVATTDYYDFNEKVEIKGKKYVKSPSKVKTDKDGNKYLEINGVKFDASLANSVDGHRDRFGRDVMINEKGGFQVASGSIDLNNNKGRYILDPDYLKASDQVVAGTANKRDCYGVDNVKSVTVNGKTFYFNGNMQQDGNVVENKIAGAVYRDVREACDGMGTNKELLEKAVAGIHTPSVLAKVNNKFAGSEFDKDNGYSPLENQFGDEVTHGYAQEHLYQPMINNGAYDADNTARIAKLELNHELHGRFMGYTSTESVKRVMNLVATPEARRTLENKYDFNIVTELENDGTFLNRWGENEIRGMQATWVKNNAYEMATLKLDANGKPVFDKNGQPVYQNAGDQAIRNQVIGDLVSSDDNEYFRIGLDAVNTDGLVKYGPSADYLFL